MTTTTKYIVRYRRVEEIEFMVEATSEAEALDTFLADSDEIGSHLVSARVISIRNED